MKLKLKYTYGYIFIYVALIDNFLNKQLIQVINKSINNTYIYISTHIYIFLLKVKLQVKSQSTVRYQGENFKWRKFCYLEFILSATTVETPLEAQLLT